MVFDFDVHLFCENLKATKPPYQCPAPNCGRVYKTYAGIQFHLFNFSHDDPEVNGHNDKANGSSSGGKAVQRQNSSGPASRWHHRRVFQPSSPSAENKELSPTSLSDSQHFLEVYVAGQAFQIDVNEPLEVIIAKPKEKQNFGGGKMLEVSDKNGIDEHENDKMAHVQLQPGDSNVSTADPIKSESVAVACVSALQFSSSDQQVAVTADAVVLDGALCHQSGAMNSADSNLIQANDAISTLQSVGKQNSLTDHDSKLVHNNAVHQACHTVLNSSVEKMSIKQAAKQSSDPLPVAEYRVLKDYVKPNRIPACSQTQDYYKFVEKKPEELDVIVEYDMDEEDYAWLELHNNERVKQSLTSVTHETFELVMDRFEKEAFFRTQLSPSTPRGLNTSLDDDAVCAICLDGECQNANVILFCDLCNIAVHQECYGVPFVPEGQWLCRRCLQSPSRPVECCLCPNRGGAFKQTTNGLWAHVVCALWIPEVIFANHVFLEPIDGLERIPPARRRLKCCVCRRRGVGCCIQCHRPNCYVAFHVTCAQMAGLHMKMTALKVSNDSSSTGTVRKTAYCDLHAPGLEDTSISPAEFKAQHAEKMKRARKILAERRRAAPVVSIPVLPDHRLSQICNSLQVENCKEFVSRLKSYWALKRRSRNGVPLLRRLQTSHMSRNKEQTEPPSRHVDKTSAEMEHVTRQLKYEARVARQDTVISGRSDDTKLSVDFQLDVKSFDGKADVKLKNDDSLKLTDKEKTKSVDVRMDVSSSIVDMKTDSKKDIAISRHAASKAEVDISRIDGHVPVGNSTGNASSVRPQRRASTSVKTVENLTNKSDFDEKLADITPIVNAEQGSGKKAEVSASDRKKLRKMTSSEQLIYWQRLRQDLERVRLLLELIRKREKLKREMVRKHQAVLALQMKPFIVLLHQVLDQLEKKDIHGFFAEPVNLQEVPDYLNHIKNPMDFSTMREKIDRYCYQTLDDMVVDFNLIISNCMTYNSKETIFFRSAVKLQNHGIAIFENARSMERAVGYDPDTAIHTLDRPVALDSGESVVDDKQQAANCEDETSLEEQLQALLERLQSVQAQHPDGRSSVLKKLRKEVVRIREQLLPKHSNSTKVDGGGDATHLETDDDTQKCAKVRRKRLRLSVGDTNTSRDSAESDDQTESDVETSTVDQSQNQSTSLSPSKQAEIAETVVKRRRGRKPKSHNIQ